MSIKNDEVERLARQLAELTGESLTTAVGVSIRDRLRRVRDEQGDIARHKAHQALKLSRGSRTLWRSEVLAVEHGDLLYDEDGLPT